MRNIVIALCVIMTRIVAAQDVPDTLNRFDDSGLKVGYWKESVGESGYDYAIFRYKSGQKNGEFEVYYKGNTLAIKGTFKGEKLEGVHKSYFSNGNLKMVTNYVNGKEHGTRKMYYDQEVLKSSSEFVDDVRHGDFIEYYSNSNIKFQYSYVEGKESGRYNMYYETGELLHTGDFYQGQKKGEWLKLDVNGDTLRIDEY